MRALVIRRSWVDRILDGEKMWEIHGSRPSVEGEIGLIASRSSAVIDLCDDVDFFGPLTAAESRKNAEKAEMRPSEATLGDYRQSYAWV